MIGVLPRACVRCASPQASCAACQSACPLAAVSLGSTGPTIAADCDDCGLCVAACPVDAFQPPPWLELIRELGRGSARKGRAIGCTAASSVDVTVPCLGALSAVEIASICCEQSRPVRLVRGDCGECWRRAADVVDALAVRVRRLLRALDLPDDWLVVETEPGSRRAPSGPMLLPGGAAARGGLFSLVRSAVSVARHMPGSGNDLPRSRALLMELLGRQIHALEPEARLVFGLELPAKCDGCAVCARVCPTRALIVRDRGTERQLCLRPERCTGCALCADVCRVPGFRLLSVELEPGGFAKAPLVELASLARTSCAQCGLPTFSVGSDAQRCFVCEARSLRERGL